MIGIVYAYWASYKEDISYNHRCTLAFLLIKFPERSGETYCFCSVSSSFYYYSFSTSSFSYSCYSFFLPKFYPAEISITTGEIVLKFGHMVDMDVKLCNRILKFKMWD